jgi:hypothetical protein
MTVETRREINTPTWYSRAMDKPEQPEPSGVGRQCDSSIANNGFLVSELAKAKNRALFWKRMWVAQYSRVGSDQKPYSAREMDNAAHDEPFYSAEADDNGTILVEFSS